MPRDIDFSNEHGYAGRQAIVSPDLQDMTHQRRFIVQVAPLHLAGLEGIMLEGYKRQIVQSAVGLQVIEKAAHPRSSSLCIRPYLNVFVHSLEDWSTKFQF